MGLEPMTCGDSGGPEVIAPPAILNATTPSSVPVVLPPNVQVPVSAPFAEFL